MIHSAMVRHATDVLQIPVPYTVVVFFFGVVVGYLPLSKIVSLGPRTILYVFMPILIFEGAFAIDVYVFKQIILNVLLLAGPALGKYFLKVLARIFIMISYNNKKFI